KIISLFAGGRPLRRGANIPNQIVGGPGSAAGSAAGSPGEDIEYITDISPSDWGPLLWKFFHILSERVGRSGVDSLDRDMALALEFIVDNIPSILPCFDCQNHARAYIRSHPFGQVKTKRGAELQAFARQYFYDFHNHVRVSTGKPIMVASVEDCKKMYEVMEWQKCEMEQAVEYFSFGVHHSIIKSDIYKRWMMQVHKIRLIAGF
ncbi:hypothetical protein EB118_21265, partial [bacterium]|nr:hypothetical protein [bacterium]